MAEQDCGYILLDFFIGFFFLWLIFWHIAFSSHLFDSFVLAFACLAIWVTGCSESLDFVLIFFS